MCILDDAVQNQEKQDVIGYVQGTVPIFQSCEVPAEGYFENSPEKTPGTPNICGRDIIIKRHLKARTPSEILFDSF